ncbi:MAG: DMT family transporter [Candidatus Beckwithbacteria bacterium]|nr:DMT family transporter [Candidatus Beckwithbacteria bacterium]
MSSRVKAYLALLTMSIIWGAALPIVKPSLSLISPYQFLYFRYLIAAPLTLPIFIYYLFKLKFTGKTLLKIFALEFLGTPLLLPILYLGLQRTSSLEASFIGASGPIFVVLGGIIFLHEKEEKHEWFGLIISFLGTIILILEPLITGKNHQASFSFSGNLLIIAYNIIYTIYVLLAKKLYQSIPKLFVTSFSYSIALVTFYIFLSLFHQSTSINLLRLAPVAIASGYMAIFGSIIALTLFLFGQNLIEASEASLFTYLQGIIAIPVAWLFLSEIVSPIMILAIIIIILGVCLAEFRPKRYNRNS